MSCCICERLDVIEAALAALVTNIEAERKRESGHFHQILERLKLMANQIDALRDQFRDNTNLVAARIDRLIAQIQTSADNTATPETLADLQALSDHLRALGTDPSNPVPTLEPAA